MNPSATRKQMPRLRPLSNPLPPQVRGPSYLPRPLLTLIELSTSPSVRGGPCIPQPESVAPLGGWQTPPPESYPSAPQTSLR